MTDVQTSQRVATLGGPGTFSHQAASQLLERNPQFGGNLGYFPSVADLWASLLDGRSDAVIVQEQTSLGWSEAVRLVAPLESALYVNASIAVPFNCSLLVKPGTTLGDIRRIFGHESLRQCQRWLAEHTPGIPTVVHPENSVSAAREVAAGDGSTAVVATLITAQIAGLEPLAEGVDDGAAANWWLVTREPAFAATPGSLLVCARAGTDVGLGALVAALSSVGFDLARIYSQGSGQRLFEYDVVLSLSGVGPLADVQDAVRGADVPARLAGAWAE